MTVNVSGGKRRGRGFGRAVLGLVGDALGLSTLGRDEAALEIWHTVKLTAEFMADKADEVRSFDAYRRLEGKLFAELDEEVYARTGTGPEYQLVRYSAGSAADPRGRHPDWNRSVELAANAPAGGVLLLHGMSDAPYSLRALGEALNRRGYWVLAPRLPGHGTVPAGLKGIGWEDMALTVRLAMAHLTAKVGMKPLHIVSYSSGATLALDFVLDALDGSAAPMPGSLILISPAVGIHPAAALAKWRGRLAALPGLERLAWRGILPEFDPYKYNSFATNAGDQVYRLTRAVAGRVEALARSAPGAALPPILVFKSAVDATVSTDAVVDKLLVYLAPGRHEMVLFDINRHAVASPFLVSDPRALTDRLVGDGTLPFALTVVTNESPQSTQVIAHHKPPFSAEASGSAPLNLAWPWGVISLSHVALPFPPDDPLYGQYPPDNPDALFLGQIEIQGERGLLKLPADWLLRLRHNPFYAYLETRALDWIENAKGEGPDERD